MLAISCWLRWVGNRVTGLGKEGEGRVEPVMVQQFESRAGLGASKGHDASKWQGPGGQQQRALDMVSSSQVWLDRVE